MLKRFFFLTLLLVCQSSFLSQDVQRLTDPFIQDLIIKRSRRLESLFTDVVVSINDKTGNIQVRQQKKMIREFVVEKNQKLTIERIISFFLNVEETLLIMESLNAKTSDIPKRIDVIDALYEYPFVDETGNYLVYISDKGTGNRNIFILDLLKGYEQEIIIPETGDFFPVLHQQKLFFLMGVENGFSLMTYHIDTDEMIELARGKFNGLKIHDGKIYYSEGNNIFKMNDNGRLLSHYEFQQPIQSFDVNGTFFILSMLNMNQYDLYLYNVSDKSIQQLTQSMYNEMDIVFKNQRTIVFSSNQKGAYGIYTKNITNKSVNAGEQLIYHEPRWDIYYPFYSKYYSKIISSMYEAGKEPKFLILSF